MSEPAGLTRRLAAVLYDALLLAALWMVASAPVLALNHGEAVPSGHWGYRAYLVAIAWAFFAGFWRYGGQTLGMRAWRLRLIAADGGPVGLGRATLRFLAAILSWIPAGLGFLWQLVDRERRSWHDRLSGTRLIVEPR